MTSRKQSFFERLTGARIVPEEETRGGRDHSVRLKKHWTEEENPAQPTQNDAEEQYAEEESQMPERNTDEEAELAIDMYESDNELVIQSMIAGVTPENLHISITRDRVVIRGKRALPQGIPEGRYVAQELYWGNFVREIELPFEIDTDGAEAVEKYGLLVIRLPKNDASRTHVLRVKSV